ncbi:Tyrocidine synthase 3 [Pandoraea horticolens]|uniref:Tyrocidine synthase 3 n=1 Tax=Pandoraea horticolens TaxID=2508298 RepID=A0A5E4WEX4_9BURK|nr:non-ribosomal peptide synthetase [Pandoraea horticolens]VVE23382.1 Tyrocidine synthase 3 [Pandoraea horticolens]
MAMEDIDRALLELLMLDTRALPETGSDIEGEGAAPFLSEPATPPHAVPLSFAQRRLWMAQQFAPDDDAYHIARVFRLRGGPIDANAVEQAIRTVIARHDVLRTRFSMQDGEPSQTVLSEVPFAMTRLDWCNTPVSGIDARVSALASENARTPFDPGVAPMLRVTWIDLPMQQHVLAVTMHHLISDAASNDVWAREFAQAYLAVAQGTDPMATLPSLAIQYADYAQRQHSGLVSGRWQAALDGWRRDLADEYGPLQLPAPLTREAGVRRGVLRHGLDASRHAALSAWCQQAGVTPFVALLSLWQLTLRRYHGEGDFLVGVPVDGRHVPGTPDLIGCFVGTQVYRAHHRPARTLRAHVEEVNRTRAAALDRLDVPFELALDAARRSGRNIFQTMFNFSQTDAAPQLHVGDVQVDVLTLSNDTPQFDLTLALDWHRLGADLDLEYDRDRVDGALARALLDDFGTWLDALVSDAGMTAGAVALTPRASTHLPADCLPDEVTGDGHDARLDPVPVRIASRAGLDPSRVAVVCGETRVTYGELIGRADALARRLVADGAGPDTCVGVALERSVDMVVAVLGVLRAGAAYVPLDPEYPAERLAYIVADSGLQRIVTSPDVAARLALAADIRTFEVESSEAESNDGVLDVIVQPEHLAYVIYTSGSTGRPKGVMVRHAGLSSFIASLGERPGLGIDDRWVAVTSLSFDIAALELYLPLVTGAQLIVAEKDTTRDGAALARLLTQTRATVLQATPATWRMLLDVDAHATPAGRAAHTALQGLKGLCGGEALPLDLAQSLRVRGVALWNMYGPTETTIWSLVGRFDGHKATLGAPIRATQAWVLDASLNETPVGVPGELYLGGEGLARGYWQRAPLTAERFVPHPFANDGARLYRTGDLVRRRADGDIEFMGRIDQQVKIRGFRIELGEIEAGLLACDGVREAVVTAHMGPGGARLVGYVTALQGVALDEAQLRRTIGRTLPDYMVPARVIVLPAMPLTPNGKMDRRALPVPQQSDTAYEAPRGSIEVTLAEAWRSALRLEEGARIGRDDNFYALGGDSILTLRGVAHAAQSGVESTPRQWFEAATLRALAEAVMRDVLPQSRPERLVRDGGRLRVAASHAQQRQWFLWSLQPESPAYHITGAMRLKGALDVDAVRHAFAVMVDRHEVLRTTFSDKTDGADAAALHQIVHAELPFAWQHMEVASQDDAHTRAQAFNDAPFDLRTGPLLRVALLALPGERTRPSREHILLVAMHHIVADGWSVDIVLREFVAGYQAATSGQAQALPALTLQYADIAEWQRGRLASGEQRRQLDWWRAALDDGEAAPVLLLPSDHPREPLAQYTEASVPFSLPPALTAGVRALAAARRATPFMIVLAAFQLLLSRHSGLRDIRVGVPIAGRELPESAPLIGLFMNTQVLRGRLDASQTVAQLLDRTRAHVLDAATHQALPFEALVEAMAPERSLTHTPLFQVLLNYQRDDASPVQALEGLHVERYLPRARAAQFELTLSANELASGGLTGSFDYARELFAPETIARLCEQFVSLLAAFVATPGTPLGDLALLTGEAHERLIEHGETRLAAEAFIPVHHRLEMHAAQSPEALALLHDGVALSRATLNTRANRLAHHLIALGVKPDTRVGVALTRSIDMVIGILAVLKAGGAYVPLDPDYPPQRLAHMLEDSGAALVLGHAASDHVALPDGVMRIDVNTTHQTPETAPLVTLRPEHLAYVIYTSGSTGKPKGVAVSHGGLAAHARVWASLCRLSTDDRVLQFSTMNFDGFVEQLFPALHVGAAVVLRGPQLWSADEFVANVARDGVTVVDLPTAYWNVLAQALDGASNAPLPGVRQLHVGGEAMSAQGLQRWRDHAGLRHIRLLNTYGPTEAVVTASAWTAGDAARDSVASVPIGRALEGRRLYIVTPDMTLAPQGAIGELLIGGDLLARGYLERAAQTAERFVPDPFGAPGSRAYRTGDLVRWRADGALEYIGRADFQVKIRGFRVELGEIEAALLAQPGVREAVVAAFDSDAGTRLAAYVTGQEGRIPDAAVLRAALEASLPTPLVPSAIVALDVLPMTPGGKLDRGALPAPWFEQNGYVAPASEREVALAEVWAEVLGVTRVGRDDNFFSLGGDSILVLRVVARAAARSITLSPRQLFVHRSLAALAAASLATAGAGMAPIPRTRQSRQALPMSHAQRRLWFLWHLQPDSSAYHVAGGIGLRGTLDVTAVRNAFAYIVARHEVLRTTFEVPAGGTEAVQVVHDSPDFAWQVFDTSAEDAPAKAQAFADAPFDLQRGPLLRVGVMRLTGASSDTDAADYALLIAMHHIVADGWSVGVLLDEFVTAYTTQRRANEDTLTPARAELPKLPIQYGDYAAWQRATFDGTERERQLAYWRALLGDIHPVADLPHDHRRHPTGVYKAARHPFQLDATTVASVREAARRHGVTPYVLLLSAFQALLHRWCAQSEVRVGVPVSGRDQPEVANLIGVFINTLVMRADFPARLRTAELVEMVGERTQQAMDHQTLPFDSLVDALSPTRSVSHTPLFQVMFNHQREDYRVLRELPDLTTRHFDTGGEAAQFELTLNVSEASDGTIAGSFTYARELFEASTMARLSRQYETMLSALCAADDAVIDDIALLDTEAAAQLDAWGVATEDFSADVPVHVRMTAQAQRTPDAIAVRADDEVLTYAALERRSNQLAHALMSQGVGPDVPVAVALERGAGMLVALLGVLKAGGCYVPLDPAYPVERLRYMLAHSGVTRLVTQSSLQATLPLPAGSACLILDRLGSFDAETYSDIAPDVHIGAEHLAYVIYTSGSTGKPKGVMVRHGGLSNFMSSLAQRPGLNASDRWVAVTSLSFDIAALELFLPLISGAQVIVASRDTARDGVALAALLQTSGATVLQSTPATWRMLLAAGKPWPALRALCGGEALPPDLADALCARGCELWNLYGPTEATIWSMLGRVVGKPVLGQVIAGTQARVLDARLQPVPPGVAGELYLGGSGLARGYFGRADLSAERFIPDPFSPDGQRLYRTGDLARWKHDGTLEFLGRTDHQVKIRGHRIELGEIESRLAACAGVGAAVVVAHEGATGAQLVGYVCPEAGAAGTEALKVDVLRGELAAQLPDYMVPAVILVLSTLPLTPNGKIDRKALPAPDIAPRHFVAPEPGDETLLADVWREVLDVEPIGRDDNFFALGGHSLQAMQIVSLLATKHGKVLALRDVFAAATLSALARCIAQASPETTGAIAPIPLRDDSQRAPLTHGQARLWFLWQMAPASAAYHMTGAFRLDGQLDTRALQLAVADVVKRHDVLHSRFESVDDTPWQVVDAPDAFGWAIENLELSGVALNERLRALSSRPIDLTHGPILRVTLLRVGEASHVLHFATHHIVADEWSVGVLARDFGHAYTARLAGDAPVFTPLAAQYGDFSAWHREWLDEARESAQLDYWRQRLGDEYPVLELPVARKRTSLRADLGARITAELPGNVSQGVRALARRHGTTPFTVLLSAWQLTLSRYAAQKDVRVGVPVAGRVHPSTDDLVGFFVNTLVIRAEFAGLQTLGDLLAQTRARMIEAQANQDVPFARIVDALQVQRSLSHTPLFQVMFNYGARPDKPTALPGLQFALLANEAATARFDLVLNVFEDDAFGLSLTYACDIFERDTIAEMLACYRAVLDRLVRDETMATPPDVALGDVRLVEVPTEVNAKPGSGSVTGKPWRPVTQALIETARAYAAKRAVHCEGEHLTYAELDAWSECVARRLIASGVQREERVGLCLQRSAAIVPALIGVLRAGAAFVPLDPEYPADRLAYMMEDAGVSCLLTDAETRESLATLFAQCDAIDVGQLHPKHMPVGVAVATETAESVKTLNDIEVHGDQLAYVIYTSGSTGRPKGVAVSHRSLALHLNDFIATYGISSSDRQLQSSTINFDVALHEMLPSLMRGGSIEMRGAKPWDLATMNRQLVAQQVTFARIPTAYWQQWLREPPAPASLALRQITVGGEGLPGDALRQWRSGPLAHIRLDNLYGPTETTVACMYRPTQDADCEQPIVSIGGPYPSRDVYVCDDASNVLPAGALGELCIGGETLARGYLGRAALSAEKFVPDPHRSDGARMYRSGDLCRQHLDGTIDFLGRIDQQVKLRGFRIELGEVESALRSVPGVREAVAELRGQGDDRQLVGYVTGDAALIDTGTLRDALQTRLPAFMIPGTFVQLDALPLMLNGKLNRAALPEPSAPVPAEAAQGPATPTESLLFDIWRDTLGRDGFGRHDNFFAIGGDSLAALRVAANAQRRGIAHFSLEGLFSHPSVAGLASWLDEASQGRPANIVTLNSATAARQLFAIHPGYGLVGEYRALASALDGVAQVHGVQSPMYTDADWATPSLDALARDYATAIRRVQPNGPYRLLGWSSGAAIARHVAGVLVADGNVVDFLGSVDGEAPQSVASFDEALNGPLKDVPDMKQAMAVEDAEIDRLQAAMLDDAERWQGVVPEGEDGRRWLATVLRIGKHFDAVSARGLDAEPLPVPMHLWLARSDGDTTAALDAIAATRAWREHTSSVAVESFDTDHTGIVRHPDFIASLHRAISALRQPDTTASASDTTPGHHS